MDQYYEPQEDLEWDLYEEMHRLIEINPWAWQSISAVSGLIGCAVSPVVGTLLIAVASFVHSEWIVSSLNGVSIVCFVLTIPLLAFGAHCLDLLEQKSARLVLVENQQSQGPVINSGRDTEEKVRGRLRLTGASAALAFLFVLPASGYAQQTIFNVPTTDVLDQGNRAGGAAGK